MDHHKLQPCCSKTSANLTNPDASLVPSIELLRNKARKSKEIINSVTEGSLKH